MSFLFSVTVVSAASSVLKRLLATKTGLAFYGTYNNNMDNAFKYLHPFKPAKNKNVSDLQQLALENNYFLNFYYVIYNI